jgi:putative peptidoglycan lipid II flippase
LNTVLSIILFIYIGFVGIAIATSISAWISVFVLYYYLQKNCYFIFSSKIIKPTILVLLASFIIGIYIYFFKDYFDEIFISFYLGETFFLLFLVLSSILLYLFIISFYKPFSYTEIKKVFNK